MPKKSKNLCVDDLRHAEYYGMQPVFDELYRRSLDGDNFTDLMDIILSRDNILLAYRNIKANGGSYCEADQNHITSLQGERLTSAGSWPGRERRLSAPAAPGASARRRR